MLQWTDVRHRDLDVSKLCLDSETYGVHLRERDKQVSLFIQACQFFSQTLQTLFDVFPSCCGVQRCYTVAACSMLRVRDLLSVWSNTWELVLEKYLALWRSSAFPCHLSSQFRLFLSHIYFFSVFPNNGANKLSMEFEQQYSCVWADCCLQTARWWCRPVLQPRSCGYSECCNFLPWWHLCSQPSWLQYWFPLRGLWVWQAAYPSLPRGKSILWIVNHKVTKGRPPKSESLQASLLWGQGDPRGDKLIPT